MFVCVMSAEALYKLTSNILSLQQGYLLFPDVE